MRIEHVGYMVEDPAAVAQWYVEHLGFRIARRLEDQAATHFLADGAGTGVLEIYHSPGLPLPNYRAMDPLLLHVAFDVEAEPIGIAAARLLAAGATIAAPLKTTAQGDCLIMLRDPWGLAIQLANRKQALA